MTMLLDGAFVDVIFASPVTLEKGSGYQLHVTFAPATAEDKAGLVYGEGGQADPAMPLADRLSSDWTLRTAALQYNHQSHRRRLCPAGLRARWRRWRSPP